MAVLDTSAKSPILRLSMDDFTRPGLLTPEEIAGKTPVSRIISVQNTEEPAAGSLTQYENATSPKGVRTEFNLVAAGQRNPDAVTAEMTIEASISKSSGIESRGWFIPRAVETEPRTYFSLTASLRLRNEQYRTQTLKQFTVGAMQDPQDPNSFIVQYVLQSQPDMAGLTGAFRAGGLAEVRKLQENDPVLPNAQVIEKIRNVIANYAPPFEQLRDNPAAARTTVNLGQGPA